MAKRNVRRRDFSKVKEKALKILKISAKTLVSIMGIAITVAFIAVPFLHNQINDIVAKCIWYPSCLLFVAFAITTVFKKPKTPSKYPIFDFLGDLGLVPVVVLFGSAFLINYYDITYTWWWAAFVLVFLYIPVFTFGMRNFLKKDKEHTDEQLKSSLKICWKYVCFYWLIDLFYMANFNYWIANEQSKTIWLALQFVFGGLAMVYIFYNLTRAFLSNTQKRWWWLLQDFLWGATITVYLIFLIPNESLQTIVLSITAAVYGGLLTLVGVAWTIKDANEKRKEDLARIENERKEEERNKNIPYVRMDYSRELPPLVANARITEGLDFGNPEDRKKLNGKSFVQIMIKDFQIKNVSNTNIIMHGVIAFGKYYEFIIKEIVESGARCMVKTTNNYAISSAQPEQSIFLIMSDMLGNKYKTECRLSLDVGVDSFRMAVTVGDEELIGYDYKCHVCSMDLPILIKNAKMD